MRNSFIRLERAANYLTQLKFAIIFLVVVVMIGPSAAVLRGNTFMARADGWVDAGCSDIPYYSNPRYLNGGPGLSFASGGVRGAPCKMLGIEMSADSFSSADLAHGVLKAAAHSVGLPGSFVQAHGNATLMDTITFSAPLLPAFLVSATLSADYSLVASNVPPDCSNVASIGINLGFSRVDDPIPFNRTGVRVIPECTGNNFPANGSLGTGTGPLLAHDGEQWVISSSLFALTRVTASSDASNTAHLAINLPPGVSYTSASGVLLQEPSSAPEPSNLFLLGTGFVGLLARFKTGRKRIR